MKKKKISISTLFLFMIFFIGLFILVYPAVSNYINEKNSSYAVESYMEQVEQSSAFELEEKLQIATQYNKELAQNSSNFIDGPVNDENYGSILNISEDGMMGYLVIAQLDVRLPLFHGTAKKTLNSAAGHLEGSSLPIGGEGTHAVITSHRGLPTAKLFTDLDQLEIGDQFYLNVLGETLHYTIDQIKIVLPEEIEELAIASDEDYVTLFTCTPYAINTHRLLVRGNRIDSPIIEKTLPKPTIRRVNPIKVILAISILSIFIRPGVAFFYSKLALVKNKN